MKIREKLLSLSDKGTKVYKEAMSEVTALQESIVEQAVLDEQEILAAIRTFEKLKIYYKEAFA